MERFESLLPVLVDSSDVELPSEPEIKDQVNSYIGVFSVDNLFNPAYGTGNLLKTYGFLNEDVKNEYKQLNGQSVRFYVDEERDLIVKIFAIDSVIPSKSSFPSDTSPKPHHIR